MDDITFARCEGRTLVFVCLLTGAEIRFEATR
jgi:hypothetical protein